MPTIITATAATLRSPKSDANRRNLFVTLLPVLVAGFFCAAAWTQRTIHAEKQFGSLTQKEAARLSEEFVSRITGQPGKVTEIAPLSADSVLRNSRLREWHATCTTPNGDYTVRINADTRSVFSINRLPKTTGRPGNKPVTLAAAERMAQSYLTEAGAGKLGPLTAKSEPLRVPGGDCTSVWLFTARHSVPGVGMRTIKVAVNTSGGGLESLWNPMTL